jgi:hypothetical protein
MLILKDGPTAKPKGFTLVTLEPPESDPRTICSIHVEPNPEGGALSMSASTHEKGAVPKGSFAASARGRRQRTVSTRSPSFPFRMLAPSTPHRLTRPPGKPVPPAEASEPFAVLRSAQGIRMFCCAAQVACYRPATAKAVTSVLESGHHPQHPCLTLSTEAPSTTLGLYCSEEQSVAVTLSKLRCCLRKRSQP